METLGLEDLVAFACNLQQSRDNAVEEKKEPKLIGALNEPTRNAVFVGGALEMRDKPLPTRRHAMLTVDDFADAVRHWGIDEAEHIATIFIAVDGFTLVCDDQYRLDRVRMPLATSEAFHKVRDLIDGTTFNHRELLQLLRTDLRDVLDDDGRTFFAKARSIKFKRAESGHSSLSASGSSMGQSVEMELHGVEGEDLPEEFHVTLPVFMYPAPSDVVERIRIDVTCDFASATFRLAVNGDEIQRATIQSLKAIRGKLIEAIGDDFPANRILLGVCDG